MDIKPENYSRDTIDPFPHVVETMTLQEVLDAFAWGASEEFDNIGKVKPISSIELMRAIHKLMAKEANE